MPGEGEGERGSYRCEVHSRKMRKPQLDLKHANLTKSEVYGTEFQEVRGSEIIFRKKATHACTVKW